MSTADAVVSPVVRPAARADIAAITEIYADAVRGGTASYELEPPSQDEMTSRFDALKQGGFPYLVGETDGAVVGYAYAGPFRPRPAYRFIVENSIYLAPAARGLGIGSLLLARLIEEAAALGFRQMIAVIGDGTDGSASVRLHKKMGFRHCGRVAAGCRFAAGAPVQRTPTPVERFHLAMKALSFHQPQMAVENAQHARQIMAALENLARCGDHRIGALPGPQFRHFGDAEHRHLA